MTLQDLWFDYGRETIKVCLNVSFRYREYPFFGNLQIVKLVLLNV